MNPDYLLFEMTVNHAFSFADGLHKGQFRKSSGAPYIVHPRGVYKILRKLGVKDRETIIASILHDTVEDTTATYNLIKKEFSLGVANLVKEVTSDKKLIGIIGKEEYLLNKMLKMSDSGLIIKLADRVHNLQDITTGSKSFADKMYLQTTYIVRNLEKERNLKQLHKKLIKLIDKQLNLYKETYNT